MVLEHTVLHHTSLTHMVLEHMLLERVVRERGGAEAQCPSKALLTHLVFQKNPNMYLPAAIPNHYPVSLTGIIFCVPPYRCPVLNAATANCQVPLSPPSARWKFQGI